MKYCVLLSVLFICSTCSLALPSSIKIINQSGAGITVIPKLPTVKKFTVENGDAEYFEVYPQTVQLTISSSELLYHQTFEVTIGYMEYLEIRFTFTETGQGPKIITTQDQSTQ